jgi:hypothetical protein
MIDDAHHPQRYVDHERRLACRGAGRNGADDLVLVPPWASRDAGGSQNANTGVH